MSYILGILHSRHI